MRGVEGLELLSPAPANGERGIAALLGRLGHHTDDSPDPACTAGFQCRARTYLRFGAGALRALRLSWDHLP